MGAARSAARRLLCGALALLGCAAPRPAPRSPPSLLDGYDFEAGRRFPLPHALREISGLTTTPDGRVFAHNDERALLYEIGVAQGRAGQGQALFGEPPPRGDFEGVAFAGDRFVLQASDGVLLFAGGPGQGPETVDTGLGRHCEMEGVAWDAAHARLLLACKQLRGGRRSEGGLTLLTWSPRERKAGSPLTLSRTQLAELGPDTLHASDVAIHPGTGHIVVLAGRERALADLTAEGAPVAVRALPAGHAQPEGLTFLPDGTMLVSDEGGRGPGSITVYRSR